jgi:hypothetical protein
MVTCTNLILRFLVTTGTLVASSAYSSEITGGVYSSMVFSPISGDLNGVEIHIIYSREGYFLTFQSSEGVPDIPVLVPALVKGTSISFKLPQASGASRIFTGTFSQRCLTGRFDDGSFTTDNNPALALCIRSSYWQTRGRHMR